MSKIRTSSAVLLIICSLVLTLVDSAYINYDGNRIFYQFSKQISVKMIKDNGAPLVNGCSCQEYAFTSCNFVQQINGGNLVVTFNITPPALNYGFCTLKDGDNNIVTSIAILGFFLIFKI
jgi:hypothetical protein